MAGENEMSSPGYRSRLKNPRPTPRHLARLAVVLLVGYPAVAVAPTAEVSPFVGYRLGGGFFERVTNQPVDLDGAPVLGGVLNVAMHDGLWFEVRHCILSDAIDLCAAGEP